MSKEISRYEQSPVVVALQAAQTMLSEGDTESAKRAFESILAETGADSIEGVLCMSSLASIYERAGDVDSAVSYNMRLIGNKKVNSLPQFVKAAHAKRAASLLESVGKMDDAEHLRRLAEKAEADLARENAPIVHNVEPDEQWVLHAIQDSAYGFSSGARLNKAPSIEFDRVDGIDDTAAQIASLGERRPRTPAPPTAPHGFNRDGNGESGISRPVQSKRIEKKPKKSFLFNFITGVAAPKMHDDRAVRDQEEFNQRATGPKPKVPKSRGQAAGAPNFKSERPGRESGSFEKLAESPYAPPPPSSGGIMNFLRNVAFGGSSQVQPSAPVNYSKPQKLDDAETKAAGAANFLGFLVILVIAAVAAWNLVPRHGSPYEEYQKSAHEFTDISEAYRLWLPSPSECELTIGSKHQNAKLKYFFGDFREILTIIFSGAFEHNEFLQKDPQGLKLTNGTLLYIDDGPEVTLARKTEEVVRSAGSYFGQHEEYPTKSAELKKICQKYDNPFTEESSVPTILSVSLGSAKDDSSDSLRAKFYGDLTSGDFWTNDGRVLTPGQIACCSATFKSTRGDIRTFVATVAGSDGLVLRSGHDQDAIFFADEDGRPRKEEAPKLENVSTVWIFTRPIDATLFFWFKEAGWMTFLGMAILTLSGAFTLSKKDPMRVMVFVAAAGFLITSILYFVNSRMH